MQTITVKLQSAFDQSTNEQMEQKGFVLHQIFRTDEGWAGLFKRNQYPDWDKLYVRLMDSSIYQFALNNALGNTAVSSTLAIVIDAIQYGITGSGSNEVAIPTFQSAINGVYATLAANDTPFTEEHTARFDELLKAFGFTTIVLP